jgi:hypothetical protein
MNGRKRLKIMLRRKLLRWFRVYLGIDLEDWGRI